MDKTMFDVAQILSNLSSNTSFDKNDTSILISGDYSVPESGIVGLLSFAARAFGKGDLLAGAIRSGDGNWSGSYNIQIRNVGSLIEKVYPVIRDKHLIDRSEAKEDKQYNENLQNLTEELDKANAKISKLVRDLEEARESKANLEAELNHVNGILREEMEELK